MSDVVLWHNPRCSKSRAALSLLQDAGHRVTIRRYLEDVPSADEITAVRDLLGIPLIGMLRPREAAFKDAGLNRDSSETDLIAAVAQNPILIERPIALANGKAALGRPPEEVLKIL